jgi:cytochrome P450
MIQRAFFTPLSTVPGPWPAKFSSTLLKYHTLRGQRVQYIHDLHEAYGPVVRISPDTVDISDLLGYHAIHKIGSGFHKSQWYPRFRTAYKHQDVFSETDSKNHAMRRKMLSRPFSKSNLRQNWTELVNERAQRAIQKIKKTAQAGTCNVFDWWTFMAIDVIGKVAFGESFDMLELGKVSYSGYPYDIGSCRSFSRADGQCSR